MPIDYSQLYIYRGTIVDVVDGDTLTIMVDLGFDVKIKERFRLLASTGGVNTPEMHDKDAAVRAVAMMAKLRMMELAKVGAEVLLKTEKDKQDGFRRYLAQIINGDDVNVGDALLVENLAASWVGR